MDGDMHTVNSHLANQIIHALNAGRGQIGEILGALERNIHHIPDTNRLFDQAVTVLNDDFDQIIEAVVNNMSGNMVNLSPTMQQCVVLYSVNSAEICHQPVGLYSRAPAGSFMQTEDL